MICTSNASLLMIEPSANVSAEPVIDALTLRMAAALLKARAAHAAAPRGLFMSTRGWHTAASGAMSDNVEWIVEAADAAIQLETNSLAVHYLAWSRHEVPAAELAKVELLPLDLADAEDLEVKKLINPAGFFV